MESPTNPGRFKKPRHHSLKSTALNNRATPLALTTECGCGISAHPLYQHLTSTKDINGVSSGVMWNFEKFLVPRGQITRFRPQVTPDDPDVIAAIEKALSDLGHWVSC